MSREKALIKNTGILALGDFFPKFLTIKKRKKIIGGDIVIINFFFISNFHVLES